MLRILTACLLLAPALWSQSAVTPGAQVATGSQVVAGTAANPITHIMIIVMENRTPDNLFQTMGPKGNNSADISTTGLIRTGTVPMTSTTLAAEFDMAHTWEAYVGSWNGGAMNFFDQGCSFQAPLTQCPTNPAETYVQASDVVPYTHLAQTYTFGDRMFQSAGDESQPAHQYIFGGTAQDAVGSVLSERNNVVGYTKSAGCGEPTANMPMVNINTGATSTITNSCFEHPVLTDELEAASLTWKYYAGQSPNYSGGACNGIWTAPNQIGHICQLPVSGIGCCTNTEFAAHVSYTSTLTTVAVLNDISSHTLANVTWVIPPDVYSDHGQSNNGGGPSWVIAITNAIGGSSYWNNTAIFIIWDDWGGLYDHVPMNVAAGVPNGSYPTAGPGIYNKVEYGFRVPLIVVSQFAKRGYVSHYTHDFGSILRYIETTFGLGTIGAGTYVDARCSDFAAPFGDVFNYSQSNTYSKLRRFYPIDAPLDAEYFLNGDKQEHGPPDTDMGQTDVDRERLYAQSKWDRYRAAVGDSMPHSDPFPLTVEHALSPKLPDGYMFFASDRTDVGRGKLYQGYLRIQKHPWRLWHRRTMTLDWVSPIVIVEPQKFRSLKKKQVIAVEYEVSNIKVDPELAKHKRVFKDDDDD